MLIEMLLKPFVLPVVIALAAWAVLAGPALRRVRRPHGVPAFAGAAGMAVAVVAGQAIARQMRTPWPTSWIDWTPTLLGIGLAIAGWLTLGAALVRRPVGARTLGSISAAAAGVAIWPIVSRYANASGWSTAATIAFVLAASVVAGVLAALIGRLEPAGKHGTASHDPANNTSSPNEPAAPRVGDALFPLGGVGAMLGVVAGGVFGWGSFASSMHVAMLGLIAGVMALLALPPLRWVGGFSLRGLAPVIAITLIVLGAPAIPASSDPIHWLSAALLALAPLSVALLARNPAAGMPSPGIRRHLLGLVGCLAAAGVLTGGSLAISQGVITLPGGAGQAEEEDEYDADFYSNWTP
jgi:hypothetical protein